MRTVPASSSGPIRWMRPRCGTAGRGRNAGGDRFVVKVTDASGAAATQDVTITLVGTGGGAGQQVSALFLLRSHRWARRVRLRPLRDPEGGRARRAGRSPPCSPRWKRGRRACWRRRRTLKGPGRGSSAGPPFAGGGRRLSRRHRFIHSRPCAVGASRRWCTSRPTGRRCWRRMCMTCFIPCTGARMR